MSFVNVGKPVKSEKCWCIYWLNYCLREKFWKNVKSEKETVNKYCLNESKWSWKVKEKKSWGEWKFFKKGIISRGLWVLFFRIIGLQKEEFQKKMLVYMLIELLLYTISISKCFGQNLDSDEVIVNQGVLKGLNNSSCCEVFTK